MEIFILVQFIGNFFRIRLKFMKSLWGVIKFYKILVIFIWHFSLLVIFLAFIKNFEHLIKIKSILKEISFVFKSDVINWRVRMCWFCITLVWFIELFIFLERMRIGFSLEWEFWSGEVLNDGFFHYIVFL